MATVQRKVVHKQFNSPIGLYSPENVQETLDRELKAFGAQGITVDESSMNSYNTLGNSAVMRAVEEEDQEMKCGYRRVAWPPPSEERFLREFTPQPMPQYQTVPPSYNQTSQQQQLYQHPQYQHLKQQDHQEQHNQASVTPTTQSQFRLSSHNNYRQTQPYISQQQRQQQQQQAYYPTPSISFQNQQTQALPHQASVLSQPRQTTSWTQYQRYQQPSKQDISDPYQHYLSKDQIDNLQQHHNQQQLQQQPQSYLSQDYRGGSPGIITLRKETPVTQTPIPVYNSQPAAIGLKGGANMRGDLKWPPPQYKEAAARENEERRKLTMGPAFRPRRVQRDYTAFFAKNALSHHYPSYKVPPGTQHIMV